MNKGFVKITRRASVGGKTFEAGAIVGVERDTACELLRRGLAVPAADPGKRSLTVDNLNADIRRVA